MRNIVMDTEIFGYTCTDRYYLCLISVKQQKQDQQASSIHVYQYKVFINMYK